MRYFIRRAIAQCAAFAALVTIVMPAAALDPKKKLSDYVHTVWTSNEGLPQNSVSSIVQTHDGYLWIGTVEGLVRFNGHSFTVFNRHNTGALNENAITTLFIDRTGVLWIGTYGGGLVRYYHNQFSHIASVDSDISAIAESSDGVLWIGTANGLYRLSADREQVNRVEWALPSQSITALSFDNKQQRLAVGTVEGLRVFTPDLALSATPESIRRLKITKLLFDRGGGLWIGTDKGLVLLEKGRVTSYDVSRGLKPAFIASILETTDALWVGAENSLCRKKDTTFECFDEGARTPENFIASIFLDREGSLWVGHIITGLDRYRDSALTIYGSNVGLKGMITSVTEGPRGDLWITSPHTVFSLKSGSQHASVWKKLSNWGTAGIQDRSGNVWVGTPEGVEEFLSGGEIQRYSFTKVTGFYEARSGAIWIGTRKGATRLFHGTATTLTERDGLVGENVRVIFEDHAGTMWFGTNGGLNRLSDGRVENVIPVQQFSKVSYGPGTVLSIHEDRNHVLWLGTFDGGLKRFEAGHLTTYTTREGLYDNTIYAVLEDANSDLWMSSDRGLFRVSRTELENFATRNTGHIDSVPYGIGDGMQIAECNGGGQNAGFKTKNGKLLFACVGGVVAVTPIQNRLPPPVLIEDIFANRHQISEGADIPPGKADLEFHFAALSYVAPGKVKFKYKLQGYDSDWIDAGNRPTAFYTNIPPGLYNFNVVAANEDGIWSPTGASWSFQIPRHFYQTVWFLLVCTVLAMSLGSALYYLRIKGLRDRQAELERTVDQRTQELQEQVVERDRARERAEAATRSKSEFLANMSHEVRTPLNGVVGALDLAGQTELTHEQTELLGMARDSADALLTVVNDILDFSKIEAGKLTFDEVEFDLAEVAHEAMRTMALRAHQKRLELGYRVFSDVPALVVGDPGRLKQVVLNLLGNAIKFTSNGEVFLQIGFEGKTDDGRAILHLSVRDTGIGIPKEKQKTIFEAFSQADSSITRRFGGTGLGLTISMRIVSLMGGKLWVESESGKGSTFHFQVLLKAWSGERACEQIPELSGARALVLEPTQTAQSTMCSLLEAYGMEAASTDCASEAVRMACQAWEQGTPYRLLFATSGGLDLSIAELVEQLNAVPTSPSVIVLLTTDDYRLTAPMCRKLGLPHIIKPVKPRDLLSIIQKTLFSVDIHEGKDAEGSCRDLGAQPLRILLAEDNAVNQRLAVRLLERMGHNVEVVDNGQLAAERTKNRPFDLVLMDVQMPVMDGLAATRLIREQEGFTSHVPIVAMTANAMKGDREICLNAGMDGYVAKPVTQKELLAVIEQVLQMAPTSKVAAVLHAEPGGPLDSLAMPFP